MSKSSVGWAILKYAFRPLVLAAVVAGLVAAILLGCGHKPEASVEKPEPPLTLTSKILRTVQVKVNCGTDFKGSGSGVVLVGDQLGPAWVATAHHVAPRKDCFYTVVTSAGKEYIASRGPADEEHDAALLKVAYGLGKQGLLEPAHGKLGDRVVTSGYPFDCYAWKTKLSVTKGVVATLYEDRRYQYRVTAEFMPGSSGGPAWSPEGHLIGLTNAGWVFRHGPKCSNVPFDSHYYVTDAEYVFKLLREVYDVPPDPHPHF